MVKQETGSGFAKGLFSSQSMLSVLGIGALLVLYSIYRTDSVLGLVDETDWLYPLPHLATAAVFLLVFAVARHGWKGERVPWQLLDFTSAALATACVVVLYCGCDQVVPWLVQPCRVLLRIAVCYFFIAWGFAMYQGPVRATGYILCGAFVFRGTFLLLSGIVGPHVMAASLVFFPAIIAVALSALRELAFGGAIALSADGEASSGDCQESAGQSMLDDSSARWQDRVTQGVLENAIAPSPGWGQRRNALVSLCLMVACCGYLLVYSRTMWFEFQDVRGALTLQVFQAFSNVAIGIVLYLVFRRRRSPQSMATFWAIPLVAVVGVVLYALSSIDGRITLVGSFGVDFAGSILLAAIILVPFFFPRSERLASYFALSGFRALGQTLATAAFSLSLGSGIQMALSVLMLLLLLGSLALFVPIMQEMASRYSRRWRSDDMPTEGVAGSEDMAELRSQLDDLRGELQSMRTAEAAHAEGERWRELARQVGLTRREEEVFLLLSQGYTAKSIAERLVISVSTAKTHVGNVYSKMGVKSQQELLMRLDSEKE